MRGEHKFFLYSIAISCGLVLLAMMGDSRQITDAAAQGALVGFVMGALAELILLIKIIVKRLKRIVEEYSPVEKAKSVSRQIAERSAQAVRSVSDLASKSANSATKRQVSTSAKYDNLLKLKNLLDQGILTQEEFDAEKARVMSENA